MVAVSDLQGSVIKFGHGLNHQLTDLLFVSPASSKSILFHKTKPSPRVLPHLSGEGC